MLHIICVRASKIFELSVAQGSRRRVFTRTSGTCTFDFFFRARKKYLLLQRARYHLFLSRIINRHVLRDEHRHSNGTRRTTLGEFGTFLLSFFFLLCFRFSDLFCSSSRTNITKIDFFPSSTSPSSSSSLNRYCKSN